MPFNAEQQKALLAPLDPARIHTRKKQGITLQYIEGWDCIDQANAVFGFSGWGYTVTKLELTAGVWVATVLLEVRTPDGEIIQREDVGVGIPATARGTEPSPDAQETAIKSAVTDATKRALRTFGNAWGNSLYGPEPVSEAQPASNGAEKATDLSVQSGVWSRLKALVQQHKTDKAWFESQCRGYLHDLLHLEHWGELTPAQWRDFERAMTIVVTGQEPAKAAASGGPSPMDVRPGADGTWDAIGADEPAGGDPTCPTCGGAMTFREGTNKQGKAYAGHFCNDRNCLQKPIWQAA